MGRLALILSGTTGFLAVALGAFGAHGLKARLAPLADGADRLAWWNTAAHYQIAHALALGLVAYVASRTSSAAATVAIYAFVAGMLLFSGSLYVMALTGVRWLGAVTPLGGLALLVGWACVVIAAWNIRASP